MEWNGLLSVVCNCRTNIKNIPCWAYFHDEHWSYDINTHTVTINERNSGHRIPFFFTIAWGMWMLYSCYSRIQIMLMQQPTYRVFLGFIVNHRDRDRGEGSGTTRPLLHSLEYQITGLCRPSLFLQHRFLHSNLRSIFSQMFAVTDDCTHNTRMRKEAIYSPFFK